jgi:hypothetical protein
MSLPQPPTRAFCLPRNLPPQYSIFAPASPTLTRLFASLCKPPAPLLCRRRPPPSAPIGPLATVSVSSFLHPRLCLLLPPHVPLLLPPPRMWPSPSIQGGGTVTVGTDDSRGRCHLGTLAGSRLHHSPPQSSSLVASPATIYAAVAVSSALDSDHLRRHRRCRCRIATRIVCLLQPGFEGTSNWILLFAARPPCPAKRQFVLWPHARLCSRLPVKLVALVECSNRS